MYLMNLLVVARIEMEGCLGGGIGAIEPRTYVSELGLELGVPVLGFKVAVLYSNLPIMLQHDGRLTWVGPLLRAHLSRCYRGREYMYM